MAKYLSKSIASKVSKIPDEGINEQDENGWTHLHHFAKNNKTKEAKALLKRGADANITDNQGRTPLYIAARYGNIRFCDTLLDQKNYSEQASASVFPLLSRKETADPGALKKAIQLCLSNGGQIIEQDPELNTPLHLAAEHGSLATIKFLLQKQADPNARNMMNVTPLHNAVLRNRPDVVKLLLETSCASYSVPNSSRQTPIDIAKSQNNQEIIDMLSQAKKEITRAVDMSTISLENPLPVRYGHTSIVYKGKLYIIGGCNTTDFKRATKFYSDVVEIDLNTLQVTSHKCNMSREVVGFSATLNENFVYITGGVNKQHEKSKYLWSLDLTNFTWKQLLALPATIPTDFHSCAPASRIEILYLASTNNNKFDHLYYYNIASGEWVQQAADESKFPPYREQYTCTKVRTKIYLFGGINSQGQFLNDLWIYDQRTRSWTEVQASGVLPFPRCRHSATSVGSYLFVAGGIGKANEETSESDIIYGLDSDKNIWYPYSVTGSNANLRIYSGFLVGCQPRSFYIYGGCKQTELWLGKMETILTQSNETTDGRPIANSRPPSKRRHGHGLSNLISSTKGTAAKGSLRLNRILGNATDSPPSPVAPVPPARTGTPQHEEKEKEKPKKNFITYMEHVEELEEYQNTLCTDSLHFLSLLTQYNPETSTNEDLLLLKSMCEELSIFCQSQPATFTDPQVLAKLKEEKQKQARFEKKNFPMHYYSSMGVAHEYNHPLPENFESYSKEEKSRYHIFNEIVQTETLYVNDLAITIGLYMKPLQNEFKDLVSSYEFASLFKNIESIFELNQKLLSMLQAEQQKPDRQQDVGNVILSCLDEIERKYITYSANQIAANDTYIELTKSSSEFEAFCNLVISLPESKNLNLSSYLIKPFQRICRYSLLLKELEKQTPNSWPTYPNIQRAKQAIDVIVGKANESKRKADSLVQVLEIQNRFDFEEQQLLQLHKLTFVQEGILKVIPPTKKKPRSVCVFLFKETFVITTGTGKKLCKLDSIPTASMEILDYDGSKQKNYFSLVNKFTNEIYSIGSDSVDTKEEWLSLFQTVIP